MPWPTLLHTPRLTLRPLVEGDLPVLVRELGRWEVAEWLIRVPHPYAEADARWWLEDCAAKEASGDRFHRAICLRGAEDTILGAAAIGVNDFAPGDGELGYWLTPAAWGRGIMTEAAGALVDAAFREIGMVRVRSAADPGNHGSNAVLRKLGFRLDRVDPAAPRYLRGDPGPMNLYRLDRHDWEARHGRG
ncbi:GNAT family N-acetyltransferase [Aerophototrophica crusticola]|uniref:GNAT family N-acetyltransferase n=1 Tax=Aerophototrophica crusticola TaxID=1709002 RepID=A0A858R3B4_9PROT|nr:GNAT family N-acetyltransferase [Rhodospirillaceae bacterium B3]